MTNEEFEKELRELTKGLPDDELKIILEYIKGKRKACASVKIATDKTNLLPAKKG